MNMEYQYVFMDFSISQFIKQLSISSGKSMMCKCHSASVCLHCRNTLRSETEKLTSRCLEWDRKLDLDIPDDGEGTLIFF